jgi:hypothetical protein
MQGGYQKMSYFFQMMLNFFSMLLSVFQMALFIRVIWDFFFPDPDESTFYRVAYVITEPMLVLCSGLLALLGIKNDGPLDITVYVSLLLTSIIRISISPLL